jgi:hypothetical protein
MRVSGLFLSITVALAVGVATAAADGGNSENAKLCQKAGWQSVFRSDGTPFSGQGDCVSYAAQGGTLTTTTFTKSKLDCEALGGTFSTDPASNHVGLLPGRTFLWSCNNGPSQAFSVSLTFDCGDDAGPTNFGFMAFSEFPPFDSSCQSAPIP